MDITKKHTYQFSLHFFLWLVLSILLFYPFISEPRPIPPDVPIRFVVVISLFYFNYSFLVPRLLLKNRTAIYIIVSLFIILGIIFLKERYFPFRPPENIPPFPQDRHAFYMSRQFIMSIVVFSVPFVTSTALRIYIEWRRNDDLRKIVEKEKINSELQFLKTQLNPHFLFNSLNAIYSLSVKNSPDTSDAIINISELMRYMLYEADKEFVPLGKELEYIQNYVRLQRIRLSDSENVVLKISGEDKGKSIPPLLFISFIENAFKYGTDFKGRTNVKINLSIEKESIHLYVMNKIGAFRKKVESSGVGLVNIKNRLTLLYPNSHDLTVQDDGVNYEVNLTLKL
ncbi:sensor histidine kinase [Flagellimonas sp. 389]|nr:sensor histidine kinase [Flagellimonas sp. 389]